MRRSPYTTLLAPLSLLLLLPLIAQGQSLPETLPDVVPQSLSQQEELRPKNIVAWSVVVEADEKASDASRVLVKLSATIDGDWKMYAMDSPRPSRGVVMKFDALPAGVVADGRPLQFKPKRDYDRNFEMEVTYFQGSASFAAPFVVRPEADEADSIAGAVTYQICSDSRGLCLPPTSERFSVSVADAKGCLADASDPDGECEVGPLDLSLLQGNGTADEYEEVVLSGGTAVVGNDASSNFPSRGRLGGFLLLALGAGFGALLTPCVFPMIPLTVSYFTKHTSTRRRSVGMASAFGVAIVATFTLLGLLMAGLVGAAGAQTIAANPWVNLFIAVVLIGFAFSLIGFYELRLPMSLVNFANRKSGVEGGIGGVLFMAMTMTLVSFSCTAPFVGGLLAAAAGGTWVRPIVGMVAFSAAFASPFVLLAVFPRLLESLPRSGVWMNAVKVTLGFVELAAAIKFLSNADLVWGFNLISRPLAVGVTVLILIAAGLYLVGRLPVPNEPRLVHAGIGRTMFGIAFIAFGVYLVPGILGAQRTTLDPYFPPRRAGDISLLAPERAQGDADDGWIVDDVEAAFALAVQERKPVFVDFTGYSCTNCRQMESAVFPEPSVASRLGRDFVRLKLYTDGNEHGPDFQKYQIKLTGTVALPTYAVVSPLDRTLIQRVSGTTSLQYMESFLAAGSTAFRNTDEGRRAAAN